MGNITTIFFIPNSNLLKYTLPLWYHSLAARISEVTPETSENLSSLTQSFPNPSKTCYLSVFSTKVPIGDTIFTFRTGDGTAISCSSEPREGQAIYRVKAVPSFLSHFKTICVGPIPGIEPATSRSAVKHSTDRANPVAVTRTFREILDKELNVSEISVKMIRRPILRGTTVSIGIFRGLFLRDFPLSVHILIM